MAPLTWNHPQQILLKMIQHQLGIFPPQYFYSLMLSHGWLIDWLIDWLVDWVTFQLIPIPISILNFVYSELCSD